MRRGSVAAATGRVISVAVVLLSVPIVLEHLGQERFGIWATITSLTVLLTFADLGLANGLVNSIADAEVRGDRDSMKQDVSSAFVLLTAVAVLIGFSYLLLQQVVSVNALLGGTGRVDPAEITAALGAFVALFALSLPLGVARRVQMGFQESAAVYMWLALGSVLSLLGIVVVTRLGGSLAQLVGVTVGGPVLASAINCLVLFRFSRRWLMPRLGDAGLGNAKIMLRIGFLWFVIQSSVAVSYQSHLVVINHILGPAAVTAYTVPMRLFVFMPGLASLVLLPLWPAVRSAIASSDVRWVRHAFYRMIRVGALTILPPTVALLVFGPFLVSAWTDGRVEPSLGLLVALSLWAATACLVTPLAYLLAGLNAIRFQAVTHAAMAVLNLGLAVVLARRIGIEGVVIATIVANIVCIIIPSMLYAPKLLRRAEAGFAPETLGQLPPTAA